MSIIKFVPTHSIKISAVGKCTTDGGRPIARPIFCKANLWLSCALTQKKEFTLGIDGMLKISLDNYKMFSNKNLILQTIRDDARDVDEYIDSYTWRELCKDHSFKFTDALINKVFQKLSCYKVWFDKQWWVKEIGGPSADYTLIDVEPALGQLIWHDGTKCSDDWSERWNARCTACGIVTYFSKRKLCRASTFLCEPCATGEEPI